MAEPSASVASSSRNTRNDIEGVGKFRLSSAAPKGGSYKAKFQSLRERYDTVTMRREQQRRELEQAQQRLKDIQAENDLMLDAMQIVAPLQPELHAILKNIDAEAEMARPHGYPTDHPELLSQPLPRLDAPLASMDLDQVTTVNGRAPRPAGLNGHTHVGEYTSASGDRDAPMIDDMMPDPDYPPDREANGR